MSGYKFLLVGLLCSLLLPKSSLACTCIGESNLKKDFQKSFLIIKGEIKKVDTVEVVSDDKLIDIKIKAKRILIDIEYVFKGNVKSKSIFIYTGIGNGDCGYPFREKEKYIVFLNSVKCVLNGKIASIKKYLYTDICDKTEVWSLALEETLKTL